MDGFASMTRIMTAHINDLLAPQSEEECHDSVQTCEELEVQIVEDEGQDSPGTHTESLT